MLMVWSVGLQAWIIVIITAAGRDGAGKMSKLSVKGKDSL